ncbi:cyclopropane-fatty-acyl-phospholipid synthase [Folsomia candida]|uniref:cyclopropane-fatty-acyl-phospholipid synthase n=1 Tax=Folsomia candida TaxID=158441 RepID=UPI000B8F662B|nr:cyclopropane-fatty-acyl-phospholipid synthase [Folsomia candida]
MDHLVTLVLTVLDYLIIAWDFVTYCILVPFTPLIKIFIDWFFRTQLNIKVGGDVAWDIQAYNWRCYPIGLSRGLVGVAECWMNGWITVSNLELLFTKFLENKGPLKLKYIEPGSSFLLYRVRWNWFNIQTPKRAKLFCKMSYNLGPDFFKTFLDSSLLFSVSYYGRGAANIEDSQHHKMELTAEKLQLKAGMRVLDLGCGFGGLSRYLAKNFDIQVVGVTNSSSMAAYARDICYGLPVEIREIDWREISEEKAFDRIVGIEILFHIGSHNLEAFFKKLFNLLKPNGILVTTCSV